MIKKANIPNIDKKRYREHFPISEKMYHEAMQYLPAGVGSTSRAIWSGWTPYPLYIQNGQGSHVTDVDGNVFIDYLLGLGPMLLGHCPNEVTSEVIKQIQTKGTIFALGSPLETEAAKKVCDNIPGMDKIRFLNSGTEAVMCALRLARAYTGRSKVIRFEGMYHGFADTIYWNKHPSANAIDSIGVCYPEAQGPGVPDSLKDTLLICQWNDLNALTKILEENHSDIAAIITEPVMCNTGCILPKTGYLDGLRKLCNQYGILLIFDEVITGFRMGLAGGQGYYNIIPDLSIFAKGLGGGYPVAALGGKKEVMKLVDEGKVSVAGTYSGNGIALSAVSATMDYLQAGQVYQDLNRHAEKLRKGLDSLFEKSKFSAHVIGVGAMFQVWFTEKTISNYREAIEHANGKLFHIWWEEMLYQGILFHPHYLENLFVSTAHTDNDIEQTLTKAECAISLIEKRCGF